MYIGKILVVGMGPVGGFIVTYLTHKWGPDAVDITVYDPMLGKFSRKQILTIQPEIMKLIDNEFPDCIKRNFHKIGCYVKNPAFDTDGKCYSKPTSEGFFTMRTCDIEKVFYNHISKKLTNVTLNKKKLPTSLDLSKFDFIISSSGGRDHLNTLIGNKYKKEYLSNALIVTFDPKSSSRNRSGVKREGDYKVFDQEIDDVESTLKRSVDQKQLRYRGYKAKKGNYYLGVQLGKSEIESLQKYVEENGEITCKKMPKDLDVILKNAYKKYEIDGIKCNTLNVSFFPIIRQIAGVPVDFIGQSLVFLIGDTLATPHFFSGVGVNSGFRAGYFLGNLLGQTHDRKKIKQIYKREAKDIQNFLAKMSHQVTVNMDQVDDMCEKYNKKEIYQIARDNYLFPENMSKREVCLSIGRIMLKK
ncbi:MAG: hypothetical protein WD512_16775 [Candidatus Paceibacterota bacterium]